MTRAKTHLEHVRPASLLRGAGGGVIGAMAMTGMRELARGLDLIVETPPEAILREEVPSLLRSVPKERRVAAIQLAHWGYGATAGAVYGLLPEHLRIPRISGPIYGVLSWAFFEFAVAPVLGLAHAHESRPRERAALLADHVLYGTVVGAASRRHTP